MSFFDEPPLHDFPDRAIRRLLEDWRNLRDLLSEIVPDLAARFDFERAETVDRAFLMEDWRRREADVFFRIPFQAEAADQAVLVCVLIEHQSAPDPRMPLRMLLYAVLYWEREWKAWEESHAPSEPLRLTPVLPVVFHTGSEPWRTHRSLRDLIAGQEPFRAFVPEWSPLFWDLAEQSPEALLERAGAWLQALAIVRAERVETDEFRHVFAEVLRRLEILGGGEQMRRLDLLWFVLSWALRRRPRAEAPALIQTARDLQTGAERRREIEKMSETIQETWEDWAQALAAESEARGRGEEARRLLLRLLRARFGELPATLVRRVEDAEPEWCEELAERAVRVETLAELGEF